MNAPLHPPIAEGLVGRLGAEVYFANGVGGFNLAHIPDGDEKARRIVACWNSSERVPTEMLEEVDGLVAATMPYRLLQAKCRDLTEALQFAIRFHDQLNPADIERLKKVLAKPEAVPA